MEYIVQKRELTVLNTAENGERILNTPQHDTRHPCRDRKTFNKKMTERRTNN